MKLSEHNAEWFYGNELKEKQEIAKKVIAEREDDYTDYLFSIFMSIALLALSLIMGTLAVGSMKCLGVFIFIGTSVIMMFELRRFAKFKSEILNIGYEINRRNNEH